MAVHAATMEVDLHLPACRSLKEKRALVRPVVEQLRRRFSVSIAEVGCHDQWQRSQLGIAVVASTTGHVCDILDEVERYVWSRPEITVLDTSRSWFEPDA